MTLASVQIVEIEVDNPHYEPAHHGRADNPRKIKAPYNPRESYSGWLLHRGLITPAEARAATDVRQAFEALGGGGARAMDYTKEPVDGGGASDPITERQRRAGALLSECHGTLGPAGHDLVMKLAGECLWPRDLAPRDARKQDYLSMRFRECLEHLSIRWGYQKNRVAICNARG